MIKISNKECCCGCSACAQKCPKKCIKMEMDDEGFLYPVVDESICVNCNLCIKVCPIINKRKNRNSLLECYIIQNLNDSERFNSASGGFFSPLAAYIIEQEGVVFGASFNSDMKLVHSYTEEKEEINKYCGSKYIQSDINKTYEEVLSFIKSGRKVVFSGSPCQVEGLYSFLGNNDITNLITIDFICHGVPSPGLFKKYKEFMEKEFGSNLIRYTSRNKRLGYSTKDSFWAYCEFENESRIFADKEHPYVNFMNKAFFAEISSRPSCYKCSFKGKNHKSDFTIYDCWDVDKLHKEMDDNKGTTVLIVNTIKAQEIFEKISRFYKVQQVSFKSLMKFDTASMFYSMIPSPKRGEFFADVKNMSISQLYDKYLDYEPTKPKFFKKAIKKVLQLTGLLVLARKVKYTWRRS